MKKSKKIKVAIVGAGLAGLAAARTLNMHGFNTIILEARNRYGGRVWPDKSLGVMLNRGATWIHGTCGNPMMELRQQFPTRYFPVQSQKFYTFDRNGKIIPVAEIQNFENFFDSAIEEARTFALHQTQDISLAAALADILDINQWSTLKQDLFARKLRFFENYVGAEYEQLSARYWNEEENISDQGVLEDGYAAIIDGLADGCNIQLNTNAQAIRERKNEVEILTNQGSIYADVVIIAVPLGVLKAKNIRFYPELSSQKKSAINNLGMGLFNILALRFPDSFWPTDGYAFFLPKSTPFSIFFNIGRFLNQPILLGYVGGKTAHSLENLSDQEILKQTIMSLDIVFQKKCPWPEKYFLTRWSQDPWSLGSYSYLPVGATPHDRVLLAQPESNRIFFAGEATHSHFPATTQGAYLSGLREAERVIALFMQ